MLDSFYFACLGSQSQCKICFILPAWVANHSAGFVLFCLLGWPITVQDLFYLGKGISF